MKIRYFTIPNILTLGNAMCGCIALYYAFAVGDLRAVFWFVALAAVFDFLDGFAARQLGSYSEMGKQLDSLADMVSFGVVPAAALLELYLSAGGGMPQGYLIFIVALFSALRLARFNIDERQNEEFIGLPTPANALLITSFCYVCANGILPPGASVWLIVAAVVLSVLLISPVRMFSLKFRDFSLRSNVMRYVFLGLSLAALAVFGISALPFIMVSYVLVSVVRHFIYPKH